MKNCFRCGMNIEEHQTICQHCGFNFEVKKNEPRDFEKELFSLREIFKKNIDKLEKDFNLARTELKARYENDLKNIEKDYQEFKKNAG